MSIFVTAEKQLTDLDEQVTELVSRCLKLEEENRSLHGAQDSLITERASLVAKNEQARSRVEAMINRLKTLEQGA